MNIKKIFSIVFTLTFISLVVILAQNVSISSYTTIINTGETDPMLYFVISIIVIATGALVIGFLKKRRGVVGNVMKG